MAGRMGWEYSTLIKTIFHHALERNGLIGK
jgi:hypothetical protein